MTEVKLRVQVNDQIWSLHGVLSHMVRASKEVERPYVVFYADHGAQETPLRRLDAWSLLWAAENCPGFNISAFTQNGARLEIEEGLLVW